MKNPIRRAPGFRVPVEEPKLPVPFWVAALGIGVLTIFGVVATILEGPQ